MDAKVLTLFSEPLIRDIVVELAKRRRASFKEICNLSPNNGDRLNANLKRLREEELVGVVKSQYSDFDTYYLTAEGMKTVRALM
jgi:DNA-binding HxlR family transcriptional regulator